eukprot:s473_g4.t1
MTWVCKLRKLEVGGSYQPSETSERFNAKALENLRWQRAHVCPRLAPSPVQKWCHQDAGLAVQSVVQGVLGHALSEEDLKLLCKKFLNGDIALQLGLLSLLHERKKAINFLDVKRGTHPQKEDAVEELFKSAVAKFSFTSAIEHALNGLLQLKKECRVDRLPAKRQRVDAVLVAEEEPLPENLQGCHGLEDFVIEIEIKHGVAWRAERATVEGDAEKQNPGTLAALVPANASKAVQILWAAKCRSL